MTEISQSVKGGLLGRVRWRNLLVDVVLIGAAVSYASTLVQDWLLEHHTALLYLLAALHLIMLPLLTISQLMPASPGAQFILDRNERTPLGRIFIWSYVGYFGFGFIVPALLGLTVGSNLAMELSLIFGPLVLTVVAFFLLEAIDKRSDYRYSRLDAKPAVGFGRVLVFSCWLYLLCMEAMLMVAAAHPKGMPVLMILGGAVLGYLPVRLCIALAQKARPLDLIPLLAAFVHLLYRILVARTAS